MAPLFWACVLAALPAGRAAAPAAARPLKSSIVRLAAGTQNGLTADVSTAAQIQALAKLLEELNPTAHLATSELVDGQWQLVYTSTSGGSAGKIGPFVGRVEQHFDLRQGRYKNFVHLGPQAIDLVTGELQATWDVLGDALWRVNFKSISFFLLGLPIVKDKPLSQCGTWRLVYTDDDFRILWAQGGTKPENIYVLKRTGASFDR
ncbi:hypothetical protein KFE25_012140 [Diacronema lutheri]|uniref:Plastid lipid-associated protein/fibrillin conserved domain-containing protein n=2 Tax=Diacronema lutheri TaxID=2081491 RepID=A0A8J6CA72_DIALT|nr:hypothetical protein KFE25_012140 [Diacronema lutheri]